MYNPPADTHHHHLLGRHLRGQTPPNRYTPPLRRPLQRTVRILLESILFWSCLAIFLPKTAWKWKRNWTERGRVSLSNNAFLRAEGVFNIDNLWNVWFRGGAGGVNLSIRNSLESPYSGGSMIFPRMGSQFGRWMWKAIIWSIFPQKLHEIDRYLTPRGCAS